jgi:hypothetical protein
MSIGSGNGPQSLSSFARGEFSEEVENYLDDVVGDMAQIQVFSAEMVIFHRFDGHMRYQPLGNFKRRPVIDFLAGLVRLVV